MELKENTFNLVSKLYLFEENIKGDISKYQNIIGTRYITTFERGGGGGDMIQEISVGNVKK